MGNWTSLGLGRALARLLLGRQHASQRQRAIACDAPTGRVIAVQAARRVQHIGELQVLECPPDVEKMFEIDRLDLQIHRHLSEHLAREIHTDAVWATIPRAVNGRASKVLVVDRHHRILTTREHSSLVHELKHHAYLSTRYCQAVRSDPSIMGHFEFAPRLQEIQPPHLLRLYGHFTHNRVLHILTEFCQHGNLAAVLEHDERYEAKHHCRLALFRGELALKESIRQLCAAVAFLHENHVAHTNLTLENVFVSDNGQLRLGDFKEAVLVSRGARGPLAIPTPGRDGFVAPERFLVRKDAEAGIDWIQADVWSIGVIIFMLVTRQRLLNSASPFDPDFARFYRMGFATYYEAWKSDNVSRSQASVSIPDDILLLLSELLCVDPSKRSTLADVISRTDWLQQQEATIHMESSDWKL